MIHPKQINYPEYIVKIDYDDVLKLLVVVVTDIDGKVIEGLKIGEISDLENLN